MAYDEEPTEPVTWSMVKRDRLLVQHRDGYLWLFLDESPAYERWLCLNDGKLLENDMSDHCSERSTELDRLNDAWVVLA